MPNRRLRDFVSRVRVAARPRSRVSALIPHGPRVTIPVDRPLDNAPLPDGDVQQLLDEHSGLLVHKWRHYPSIYSREFGPFREGFPLETGVRPLRFLEIGVSEGGSQVFWRNYFGPTATIFGIDIDPTCADRVAADISHVRIGSQADERFLNAVCEEMGGVDIVLDDGSHEAPHQRASFEVLWPLLSPGGVYMIEDVHTAYWSQFQGGLRRPGTAIEDAKDTVDDLHRWYYREGKSADFPQVQGVESVTFYDSVIAYRKARRVEAPARFIRGSDYRR